MDKSDKKWKELDTPENFVDHGGVPPHTKRLRIPANLMCEDVSESEHENFEERAMETRGQAIKNASEDVQKRLSEEMRQGFSSSMAGPSDSMFQALPATALSTAPDAQARNVTMDFVMKVADSMNTDNGVEGGAKAGASNVKQTGPQMTPAEKMPARHEMFDVKSSQTGFIRASNGALSALQRKVAESVSKASTALRQYESHDFKHLTSDDDDEFYATAERLQMGLLWLSMQPSDPAAEDTQV
jgi:hypothetical protein